MDKNTMQQKKKKESFFQLLKLLMILVLFVISAFVNEILGMLMFGVLTFYVIIGNDSYKVNHKAYEEILQSKCEVLNYDSVTRGQERKEDTKPHMKKYHLIIIVMMFVVMCFCSYASMEFGMLVFGGIVFYILCVSA